MAHCEGLGGWHRSHPPEEEEKRRRTAAEPCAKRRAGGGEAFLQRAEHGSGSARSGAPPAAAAVAMSSDFESYEQDFAVLTADITGRIGKVPKLLGGEPGGERGLGKEPGRQGRAGQGQPPAGCLTKLAAGPCASGRGWRRRAGGVLLLLHLPGAEGSLLGSCHTVNNENRAFFFVWCRQCRSWVIGCGDSRGAGD